MTIFGSNESSHHQTNKFKILCAHSVPRASYFNFKVCEIRYKNELGKSLFTIVRTKHSVVQVDYEVCREPLSYGPNITMFCPYNSRVNFLMVDRKHPFLWATGKNDSTIIRIKHRVIRINLGIIKNALSYGSNNPMFYPYHSRVIFFCSS